MAKLYIIICSTSETPEKLPYKVLGASTTHSLAVVGMTDNKMAIGYTGRWMEVFDVDGASIKLDYRPNHRLPRNERTVFAFNVFKDKKLASDKLRELVQAEKEVNSDFDGQWKFEEGAEPPLAIGCWNKTGVKDKKILRIDIMEEEDDPPLFSGRVL